MGRQSKGRDYREYMFWSADKYDYMPQGTNNKYYLKHDNDASFRQCQISLYNPREKGRERELTMLQPASNFHHDGITSNLVDFPKSVRVGVTRSCLQVSIFLGS